MFSFSPWLFENKTKMRMSEIERYLIKLVLPAIN